MQDELKAAESVANMKKLQQIEAAWPAGGQPLLRPGRLFVHESNLEKMCRKGKDRIFARVHRDGRASRLPIEIQERSPRSFFEG